MDVFIPHVFTVHNCSCSSKTKTSRFLCFNVVFIPRPVEPCVYIIFAPMKISFLMIICISKSSLNVLVLELEDIQYFKAVIDWLFLLLDLEGCVLYAVLYAVLAVLFHPPYPPLGLI